VIRALSKSTHLFKKRRSAFILSIFLIVASIISICPFFFKKSQVSTNLIHALSEKEYQDLKLFFHNLFINNELGYTLFGDKPMSFCFPDAIKPQFSQRDFTYKIYFNGDVPLFRGFAVWKKISTSINHEKYSFIIYEDSGYPTFVILINKECFIDTVNKNIDVFKKIYGSSITAKLILEKIENKSIDQDKLFNQHLLLGIMLGYGRNAAELFQRRWSLAYGEFNPPLLEKPTLPSKGFSSVEEELQNITRRLQAKPKIFDWYTNTFPIFLRVVTVPFALDPDDPEAQSLLNKYKVLHAKLTNIFDRNDWLEIVLDRLLSK
jgi:hypothetical protein